MIVSKLETKLTQPEDIIVRQYDETDDMFIVAKGECIVNIRDEENKVIKGHRVLGHSDYFGEISLLYGSVRTATVVSRKYSTLGMLSKAKFKEICTEFPEFSLALKNGIYKYKDRMKQFLKQSLKKVDYFKEVDDKLLHEVIYNMELKHCQEGEILQRPGDLARDLYFVQDGVIEVYADFDSHNFVVERLFRGSIINYRNWFMEDECATVFLRFESAGILQKLTLDKFNELMKKNPKLEEPFLRF